MAREATEHLLSLGHRTIGMVTGPMEEDCCRDRHLGYCQALQAATLPVDDELIIEGDWSPESGYNGLCTLLAKENRLTALFMQNDSMAVGALRAARDLDLRVPEDLSVISVDDIPYSSFYASAHDVSAGLRVYRCGSDTLASGGNRESSDERTSVDFGRISTASLDRRTPATV